MLSKIFLLIFSILYKKDLILIWKNQNSGWKLKKNLVYIGTFGLEDPVRDDVHVPVHMIRYGHTEFDHD